MHFDVIVIDYVLEYVNRPYEILKEVHRVLKKGGLLIVSVPDIESLQAVWTGRYWFHLDVPKHLYHYSTLWFFCRGVHEGSALHSRSK